jgi:hypothetical protein
MILAADLTHRHETEFIEGDVSNSGGDPLRHKPM